MLDSTLLIMPPNASQIRYSPDQLEVKNVNIQYHPGVYGSLKFSGSRTAMRPYS